MAGQPAHRGVRDLSNKASLQFSVTSSQASLEAKLLKKEARFEQNNAETWSKKDEVILMISCDLNDFLATKKVVDMFWEKNNKGFIYNVFHDMMDFTKKVSFFLIWPHIVPSTKKIR